MVQIGRGPYGYRGEPALGPAKPEPVRLEPEILPGLDQLRNHAAQAHQNGHPNGQTFYPIRQGEFVDQNGQVYRAYPAAPAARPAMAPQYPVGTMITDAAAAGLAMVVSQALGAVSMMAMQAMSNMAKMAQAQSEMAIAMMGRATGQPDPNPPVAPGDFLTPRSEYSPGSPPPIRVNPTPFYF